MLLAPILENEDERLDEVHALGLLDSPPEQRFDRLVKLAKSVFGVPIAYIALVESERQWFKSECGLNVSETSREISFCGHTIAGNEIMVINDTLEDKRFMDNPMVVDHPFIRFYAGRPLKGLKGNNVGSLCVVDTVPRELNEQQLTILDDIGHIVERELQMADALSTQQSLLEARRFLDQAQARLEHELQEASAYVEDQLPPKVECDKIAIDWKYVASSHLGGDMFGYFRLNDDQWAIYLLDVAGHGIGSSLLAATVNHQITQHAIPSVDYTDPGSVLQGLNREFPMHNHQNKFFTIWYGVFDKPSKTLTYATGGHHPALLLPSSNNGAPAEAHELGGRNLIIGVSPDVPYPNARVTIEPGNQLFIFSDGAFEVGFESKNGLGYKRLKDEIVGSLASTEKPVESIYDFVKEWHGQPELTDDFSLIHVNFK